MNWNSLILKIVLWSLCAAAPFAVDAQNSNTDEYILIHVKLIPEMNQNSGFDSIIFRTNTRDFRLAIPADKSDIYVPVPKSTKGTGAYLAYLYGKQDLDSNGSRDVFGILVVVEDSLEISMNTKTMHAGVLSGRQSQAQEKYAIQSQGINEQTRLIRRLREEQAIADSVFDRERLRLLTEGNQLKESFIADHPYSFQALSLLREQVRGYLSKGWAKDPEELELKEYKNRFFSLSGEVQEKGQDVLLLLQNAENKTVPHFTGEMPDGRIFDLDSLKGKVVLIDFWGSWCIPCRQGHPHLKELYAQYKDKGFEIIGIGWERSGDRESQWTKLKKAIADDELPWPQILHDKEKRDLASEFGVNSFPSKFLVDRDGKVVLRIGSDTEELLDKKLKEIFH